MKYEFTNVHLRNLKLCLKTQFFCTCEGG